MAIRLLPDSVIAGISAGEVIERPASVVKELVENSLDAGARKIRVEIEAGGMRAIRVADDGEGIPSDQALLAFSRHATSKLSSLQDLERIKSLGFRGEALAAVASAGDVEMKTRRADALEGRLISGKAGSPLQTRPVGCEKGTDITVRNLFKKLPARLKFMRSAPAEASAAVRAVEPYALMHLSVHFVVVVDGEEKINAPPTDELYVRIREIMGTAAESMVAFSGESGGISVHGYSQAPGTVSGRGRHWLLVNSRPVEDRAIRHALISSYRGQLPRDSFPAAVIFIEVPPERLDVNVHPAKSEVRFADQQALYRTITSAMISSFGGAAGRPEASAPAPVRPDPGDQPPIPGLDSGGLAVAANVREPSSFWRRAGGAGAGDLEILSQLFETYIVARDANGLLLVDQHAAHEKIIYERLLRKGQKPSSQALLMPQSVEVSAAEAMLLRDNGDTLRRLGIEFDEFGGKSIVIRAVPQSADEAQVADMFRSLIEELQVAGRAIGDEELGRRLLATIACHMAVKAGRRLTPGEMEAIVRELFDLEDPLSCPHGRPTQARFSEPDLARMFRRI